MNKPIIAFERIYVRLKTGIDMVDITRNLISIINQSKIINGNLSATMIGSTGSITTIEYEPGVVEDLKQAITRLAPLDMEYKHEQTWHDGNGHSHVQAALLGPSVSVPIRDGQLALGTWQQVVAVNHDNKKRKRRVEVTLVGIG